ncbi:MAG TPA: rhomboid family intramembrane serine protease [Phycisphaerae bacterium]|nr:rhomboid family intramembrane serine protease [Phycisphaerae bacterium]
MRWQTRFLQKFERVAIPNITLYWVALMAVGVVLLNTKPEFAASMWLDTDKVIRGEWWRIFTFLLMPEDVNIIFSVFALYLFWIMGTALEANWGTARYNLFLLIGAVLNVVVAFIPAIVGLAGIGTNLYFLGSVFLGFAALYPDFQIRLYFVFPVRVKWLALVAWICMGIVFLFSSWTSRAMLVASVGNFFIFFWRHILERLRFGHKVMVSKAKWMARSAPEPKAYMHRCVVCGVTERSNPQLEFRYCSTCGNKCYCLEHLRGHACTNEPALK